MSSRFPALAVVAVTFCAMLSPMVLMPSADASRAGRFINLRSRVLGTLNNPPALPHGITPRSPRGAEAWRPVMPDPQEVRAVVARGDWWRYSAQRVTLDLGDESAGSENPSELADRLIRLHTAGLTQAGLRLMASSRPPPGNPAAAEGLADQAWTDLNHELLLLVQVVVTAESRQAHITLHLTERFDP